MDKPPPADRLIGKAFRTQISRGLTGGEIWYALSESSLEDQLEN